MKKSFLKDLLSVFNSRVIVILCGMIGSIVTARYLGPEGNGVIAGITVFPSLFMTIGSLGIRQSTTYFVGQNKYDLQKIYGAVLAIWMISSIFCVGASVLLINYFTSGDYSNTLIFLAVVGIPFSLYTTYSSGIFLGQQNIKAFNRINWIPATVNVVMTFILIGIFSFGIAGSMVGTFAGVFILFFFIIAMMRRTLSLKPDFNLPLIKEMLSLGIVYAISLLVINLNYKADIVILERLSTDAELGLYSKAAIIVQYLWEIPMLISTLVFSRSAGAKDPSLFSIKVCRLLRIAGVVILFGSVILYFISDFVINLMYGSRFEGSVSVLKILLPGVLLLTVFKVLNMDLAGKGKPWLSMIAMGPAVIINVVLNYVWIPKYGANGSALASTISYSFAAVVFLIVYSKTVKIPIKQILTFDHEDVALVTNSFKSIKKSLLGKLGKHDRKDKL